MRVKNAGVLLYNTNSAVVSSDRMHNSFAIADHGSKVQCQILRVHVVGEDIRESDLISSGDVHAIWSCSKVSDVNGELSWSFNCPKGSSNNADGYGFRIWVGKLEKRLGGLAVDKLDPEHLGIGECR